MAADEKRGQCPWMADNRQVDDFSIRKSARESEMVLAVQPSLLRITCSTVVAGAKPQRVKHPVSRGMILALVAEVFATAASGGRGEPKPSETSFLARADPLGGFRDVAR